MFNEVTLQSSENAVIEDLCIHTASPDHVLCQTHPPIYNKLKSC